MRKTCRLWPRSTKPSARALELQWRHGCARRPRADRIEGDDSSSGSARRRRAGVRECARRVGDHRPCAGRARAAVPVGVRSGRLGHDTAGPRSPERAGRRGRRRQRVGRRQGQRPRREVRLQRRVRHRSAHRGARPRRVRCPGGRDGRRGRLRLRRRHAQRPHRQAHDGRDHRGGVRHRAAERQPRRRAADADVVGDRRRRAALRPSGRWGHPAGERRRPQARRLHHRDRHERRRRQGGQRVDGAAHGDGKPAREVPPRRHEGRRVRLARAHLGLERPDRQRRRRPPVGRHPRRGLPRRSPALHRRRRLHRPLPGRRRPAARRRHPTEPVHRHQRRDRLPRQRLCRQCRLPGHRRG